MDDEFDSAVEARFDDLVVELLGVQGVTPPGRGRARSALRFNGKIFAMLRRGHLVVKLPDLLGRHWRARPLSSPAVDAVS
jgi:hypothetical protein